MDGETKRQLDELRVWVELGRRDNAVMRLAVTAVLRALCQIGPGPHAIVALVQEAANEVLEALREKGASDEMLAGVQEGLSKLLLEMLPSGRTLLDS